MGKFSSEEERIRFDHSFTFISLFCFETKFYQDSLALVIKDKGEKYINGHYFNFAVIVYYALQKGKILLLDASMVLVKLSNICMWKMNKKIYMDINDLNSMLFSHYKLSKGFITFQNTIKRTLLNWLIATYCWSHYFMPLFRKRWVLNNPIYLISRKIILTCISTTASLSVSISSLFKRKNIH